MIKNINWALILGWTGALFFSLFYWYGIWLIVTG